MDDEMIDLMAGDARLRRRLEAYADSRLTPDLVTSSRIRARVLAVAHRQADLARADAALTIVTAETERRAEARRPRRNRLRGPITALLAAALAAGALAGTTLAARPGGALYETRLWVETLTLPSNPSERALAELDRLHQRLVEAAEAIRSGDTNGAAAALAAYGTILERASTAAIASQDDVAVAVLEAGAGHNIEVLQALILAVPDEAADAISRAVHRAIERSDSAVERIERGQNGPGGTPNGTPGGPTAKPTKAPTPEPTPKPTKEPGGGGAPGGGPGGGQSGGQGGGGPQPTTEPGKPDRTPRPSPQHGPN